MSPTPAPTLDRAAAIRAAVVRLVARQGFHGTSMTAIAEEAGVGTGTAYVHYKSKDDLVLAAYVEVKAALGAAAASALDAADHEESFRQLWFGVHNHLAQEPDRARFLLQVDSSPYGPVAHDRATHEAGDALLGAAIGSGIADHFAALPLAVIYDLAVGPVVRLVASGVRIDEAGMNALCRACWRAATT